jgi:hypothetical protein
MSLSNNRAIIELTVGGLMLSLSALAVAFAHIGAGGAGFHECCLRRYCVSLLKVRRIPVLLKLEPNSHRFGGVFLAIDLVLWHRVSMVGPGIGSILTTVAVFFMTVLNVLAQGAAFDLFPDLHPPRVRRALFAAGARNDEFAGYRVAWRLVGPCLRYLRLLPENQHAVT